ncbi:hypothetical protein KAM347_30810 [Aeromonas caviae]|nr:hypothetical protein KAM347_30810 [Aeromonas caviae]GJA60189.1 hypothetical protein KAM350_31820 [Aeromonas caviae]GJA69227.1 hypothetical protein KAM352_32030 [Aeromonas caviae]GJB97591.1 hypothetical protein KAM383_31710 [Aeromonas caviae]
MRAVNQYEILSSIKAVAKVTPDLPIKDREEMCSVITVLANIGLDDLDRESMKMVGGGDADV